MAKLGLTLLLVAFSWSCLAPRAMAEEEKLVGKVVKAGESKLEIVNKDGENETLSVAANAVIKRNNKIVLLEDLQADDVVIVKVERKGSKGTATTIYATAPE
jgi:hypothetical protein